MKPNLLVNIAGILLIAVVPTLSPGAQTRSAETEDHTRSTAVDTSVGDHNRRYNPKLRLDEELDAAEEALIRFYERDVIVMSQREIDPSRIIKGWYAHVEYTSKAALETVSGRIAGRGAENIVIQTSTAGREESRQIAYGDISKLVVGRYLPYIDRWKRRSEQKSLIVMVRGELDPSRLIKGWYAHVVYTSHGEKGTANGEIIDKESDRIVIKARARAKRRPYRFEAGRRWEIAYGEIEVLAVSRNPRDIQEWITATHAIKSPYETASKPSFEIGANLFSFLVLIDAGSDYSSAITLAVSDPFWLTPSIYTSAFLSEAWALHVGIGAGSLTGSGSAWSNFQTAHLGIAYLPRGVTSNSVFFRPFAAFFGRSSSSLFGVGVALGHRQVVQEKMALRFEAMYARLFESELNLFQFRLIFGIVLGRRTAAPEFE